MQKGLTKISNDKPRKSDAYSGPYKDSNGSPLHGIYIRQKNQMEEKLFISNGNLMSKYEYPIIKRDFKSPMVNDYNLHLCSGWSWPGVQNKETITRVIDGKKPMGFFTTTKKEQADNLYKSVVKDSNLPSFKPKSLITPGTNSQYYELGICVKGTFEDNFDIEAFENDYYRFEGRSNNEGSLYRVLIEKFL